jgi:hypothetical protein
MADNDAKSTSEKKSLEPLGNRHQLLFSTFFLKRPGTPKDQLNSTNKNDNDNDDKNQQETIPSTTSSSHSESNSSSYNNALDGILDYVDQYLIPRDPQALRQTTLYQNSLRQVEYQRDQYMVGHEYAEWRRKQKQITNPQQQQHNTHHPTTTTRRRRTIGTVEDDYIPYDATALGHQQFAPLAARFIPTERVQKSLAPVLASVPNMVYEPTRNATVNIVLGQFHNLSRVMKMQVLQFLDNPKNRSAMKASTQGMILKNTSAAAAAAAAATSTTPSKQSSSSSSQAATTTQTRPNTVAAPTPTDATGS